MHPDLAGVYLFDKIDSPFFSYLSTLHTLVAYSFVFLSSLTFTRTQRPKHLILRTYRSSCSLDLIFFLLLFHVFFYSFFLLPQSVLLHGSSFHVGRKVCIIILFLLIQRDVFFSSSLLFFGDNTLAFLRSCLVMRVSTGRFLLYLHLFFYP